MRGLPPAIPGVMSICSSKDFSITLLFHDFFTPGLGDRFEGAARRKSGPLQPLVMLFLFQSFPLYDEDHPKSAFNFCPGLNLKAVLFLLLSR